MTRKIQIKGLVLGKFTKQSKVYDENRKSTDEVEVKHYIQIAEIITFEDNEEEAKCREVLDIKVSPATYAKTTRLIEKTMFVKEWENRNGRGYYEVEDDSDEN